jgi:hypothetical protein
MNVIASLGSTIKNNVSTFDSVSVFSQQGDLIRWILCNELETITGLKQQNQVVICFAFSSEHRIFFSSTQLNHVSGMVHTLRAVHTAL